LRAAAVCFVLAILSCSFGWWMQWEDQRPIRERHERWREAVASNPESLSGRTDVNDEDLKLLDQTTRLKELDLDYSCVSGTGLAHLQGLNQLTILTLQGASVNDDDLQYIETLSQIQELNLSSNLQLTDAALIHIRGLKKLQKLDISLTRITDAGLALLKGLIEIKELDLGNTEITDVGLEQLKALKNLEKLALEGTRITDAGLDQLKAFPNLQILGLRSTAVTDAGLKYLTALTKLKKCCLQETKVTPDGIKQLKHDCPNLELSFL
jgi:internalin A